MLRNTLTSLNKEITTLRNALQEVNSQKISHPSHFPTNFDNQGRGGTGRGRSGRGRGGKGRVGSRGRSPNVVENIRGSDTQTDGVGTMRSSVAVAGGNGDHRNGDHQKPQGDIPSNKIRVEGARRVWGTMKVTTVFTLMNALSKMFNATNLQIKRKTVLDNAGEVKRWWFIIHASESVLCNLDDTWEQLKLQTGWKLEPCFKPCSQPHSPATPQSAAHDQNRPITINSPTNANTFPTGDVSASHISAANTPNSSNTSPAENSFLDN